MENLFTDDFDGKTQADGAQTIELGGEDVCKLHQIHLSVSATPAAGTLDVSVKTPGASTFVSVGEIDMTGADLLWQFDGIVAAFQFTPTAFDADKDYGVAVASGDKS